MSEEEAERLDRIAQKYGLNQAAVIRMLLKREDDAIGSPQREPLASNEAIENAILPSARGLIDTTKVTKLVNTRKVTKLVRKRK